MEMQYVIWSEVYTTLREQQQRIEVAIERRSNGESHE